MQSTDTNYNSEYDPRLENNSDINNFDKHEIYEIAESNTNQFK